MAERLKRGERGEEIIDSIMTQAWTNQAPGGKPLRHPDFGIVVKPPPKRKPHPGRRR